MTPTGATGMKMKRQSLRILSIRENRYWSSTWKISEPTEEFRFYDFTSYKTYRKNRAHRSACVIRFLYLLELTRERVWE